MCGRFVSNTPPDELAQLLRAQAPDPGVALDPSYNVAPTQLVHAARESGGVRRLDILRWGLVPIWADLIRMHPVSNDVNNVRNDGPHLIDRLEPRGR